MLLQVMATIRLADFSEVVNKTYQDLVKSSKLVILKTSLKSSIYRTVPPTIMYNRANYVSLSG